MSEVEEANILEEVKIIDDWQEKGSRKGDKKRHKRKDKQAGGRNALLIAAITLAASAGAFLLQRYLRRRKVQNAEDLLEDDVSLPEPIRSEDKQLLSDLTFICSALFEIEGNKNTFSEPNPSVASAAAITKLLQAGARLVGRTKTEELNLGLLGDLVEGTNPNAPECSISGCGCGPALAVANGVADLAIGSDHLTGIRVQSAIFGLSGFRPSQGIISDRGRATVAGSMDSVAWLVNDASLHPKIAQAFQLPGGTSSFSTTELLQLVVAGEVFEIFGETGAKLRKTALHAAKRWAGTDMTASGYLITYLQKAVPSRKAFVGQSNDEDDVMEGIRRAAVTLQYHELLQRHGHLLEDPDALRPSVFEQLNIAQQVGEEEVSAAEMVREETNLAMRSILRESVLIIPSLPFSQPAQGTDIEELKRWERGTLQLAALASMTGCPQATLPVVLEDGSPPLGLSLLSLPKSDQRLAQVTAALAPFVKQASIDCFSANPPENLTPKSAKGGKVQNGKRPSSPDDAERETQLREAGNAAFKAGHYKDAIEKYSLALKSNPTNSILYSNRAQALIKIGHYQEAEEDCTKALNSGPNAKALLRRGTARSLLSKLDEAVQDFKHVLALEPSNRQAKMELQGLAQLGESLGSAEGLHSIMGNPNLNTARSDLSF